MVVLGSNLSLDQTGFSAGSNTTLVGNTNESFANNIGLRGGGKKKKYKNRRTKRKKRSKGKRTRNYKCKSCKRKTCKCNNKRNKKTRRNR